MIRRFALALLLACAGLGPARQVSAQTAEQLTAADRIFRLFGPETPGAAAIVEQELRESYRRVIQETLAWIVANTEMAVHDLDAARLAAWRAAANPVYEAFLERSGPVGEVLLLEARKFQ